MISRELVESTWWEASKLGWKKSAQRDAQHPSTGMYLTCRVYIFCNCDKRGAIAVHIQTAARLHFLHKLRTHCVQYAELKGVEGGKADSGGYERTIFGPPLCGMWQKKGWLLTCAWRRNLRHRYLNDAARYTWQKDRSTSIFVAVQISGGHACAPVCIEWT